MRDAIEKGNLRAWADHFLANYKVGEKNDEA
jgi:hypothetical protein